MPRETPRALVVVGASLGGVSALERLLGDLSADFPWPVAIVQHRAAEDIERTFTEMLRARCALPVAEAEDKLPIEPGSVYLAPPDYHLLVDEAAFALSTEPRVNFARPSIDVLFDAAAATFGAGVVAVVLTGASADGARGAARVKSEGGSVIVQDPATAECAVMPSAALPWADRVLPLQAIADALHRLAATRR